MLFLRHSYFMRGRQHLFNLFMLAVIIGAFGTIVWDYFGARELTPSESVIVEDFQSWIQDPGAQARIELYLPDGFNRETIKKIERKSLTAWYAAVDGHVLTYRQATGQVGTRIADANPIIDRIRIYSDTRYWKFYTAHYNKIRKDAVDSQDDCSTEHLRLSSLQPRPFNTFCHENAHLINVLNHDAVYAIGDACEKAAQDMYYEKVYKCSGVTHIILGEQL